MLFYGDYNLVKGMLFFFECFSIQFINALEACFLSCNS